MRKVIQMEAPRTELYRKAQPLEFPGTGNDFSGYAAVFRTPTVINSWEGHFIEQFEHGAFRDSLAKRSDRVKFFWDHGLDPSIGQKPIGTIKTLVEDERGLRVEATMLDRPYAQDIAEAIRAGALDGMSFKFSVVRDDWDESGDLPVRTVKQANLHEVSVVSFPAYEATQAGIRSVEAYELWRTRAATLTDNESDSAVFDSDTASENATTATLLAGVDTRRLARAELIDQAKRQLARTRTHG